MGARNGTEVQVRRGVAARTGRRLDTAALQEAIDTAASLGGARVVVPAGHYRTGSLYLRSGVVLHLDADAVLEASGKLADYHRDADQDYAPGIIGHVLIFARDARGIGLEGPGTIDGRAACFPHQMDVPRPVLIRFRDCRDVHLADLRLRDGPSWTVHLVGCQDVRVEDLDIHSLLHHNTDGLDMDGCTRVAVRGCSIVTGDDAIALKATRAGRPCTEVSIHGCRLSSFCQALRVGPETLADIRRVRARDCHLYDTGMGGICVQAAHGGTVRDLEFVRMVMDRVSNPISVRLGGWRDGDANVKPWFLDDARWQEGRLEDVVFRDIQARVPSRYLDGTAKESHTFKENEKTCITVTGTTATRPQRIVFDRVDVTFPGGGTSDDGDRKIPELDRQYPTPFMFGVPPAYGLFARHVDGLVLRQVRFHLAAPDARPPVLGEDLAEADLSGLVADLPTGAGYLNCSPTKEGGEQP